MAKGGGGETVTQGLDPATQQFVEQTLRPTAQAGIAAAQGGGPFFTGPSATFQQGVQALQGLGAGGFGAAFDPASIAQFQDPFEQQVVGGIQGDIQRQREAALTRGAQEATAAGAFGGSRSGILQAQALGDINRAEIGQLAGIRSQGFGQSLQAALGQQQLQQQAGLAGLQFGGQLGLQRAFGLQQAGEVERQIANQQAQEQLFRQQQALGFAQGGIGPFGTVQTAQQQGSLLGGAAGGALTGFAAGGPIGGLVGGGLGLLGGIFG